MGLFTMLSRFFGHNAQNSNFNSVEVDEFEKVIASSATLLLDVRTAEEYGEGHIEGEQNIDVHNDTFQQKACDRLPMDKTIALYCRSGRRSKKAAGILAAKGYQVVELSTGYLGWTGAGKNVVKQPLNQ